MILRGVARDWPFVRAALQSDQAAAAYLDRFYNGRPVNAVIAPAEEQGRFFYRPNSKQMNFQTSAQRLSELLECASSDEGSGVAAGDRDAGGVGA